MVSEMSAPLFIVVEIAENLFRWTKWLWLWWKLKVIGIFPREVATEIQVVLFLW